MLLFIYSSCVIVYAKNPKALLNIITKLFVLHLLAAFFTQNVKEHAPKYTNHFIKLLLCYQTIFCKGSTLDHITQCPHNPMHKSSTSRMHTLITRKSMN